MYLLPAFLLAIKRLCLSKKKWLLKTTTPTKLIGTPLKKWSRKVWGNSIIDKVDSILVKALAEENTAQIFKALAYRSKYTNQIEEESNLKIFTRYETQIKNSSFPLKQLLHSAVAELYHQYHNQIRWKIPKQNDHSKFSTHQDLRTWSLADILEKVE